MTVTATGILTSSRPARRPKSFGISLNSPPGSMTSGTSSLAMFVPTSSKLADEKLKSSTRSGSSPTAVMTGSGQDKQMGEVKNIDQRLGHVLCNLTDIISCGD